MMAAYHLNLSSQGDDTQNEYSQDHKLASYDELRSQRSNMEFYVDQASAAGSYSEFLSRSSLSSNKCAEFLSIGDRNEMMFIPPSSDTMNLQSIDEQFNTSPGNPIGNPVDGDSMGVSRTQLDILDTEHNFQSQGLSLSLGTEMQSAVSLPSFQYQNSNFILPSLSSPNLPLLGKWALSCEGDESNQSKGLRNPECYSGGDHDPIKAEVSNNPQCFQSHKDFHTDSYIYESSGYGNILNAKYLKPAQQLLNEVVSIKKALKQPQPGKCFDQKKETDGGRSNQSVPPTSSGMSSSPRDSSMNSSSEVSPAERQELQNKKTKLMSMLDEVDKRYKQYYHQMQFVETSFDMLVGQGAAKSYTALALQTISRHFRCLRDAISNQIEIIRKRLGEEDNGQGPIPRLRFVDQQLRQQRMLQQLGVMRHAWRPQRGLPENSVSVLRAWLFEHFLHPYPNDSEKIILAKQTGLTRNQVANWFINARVRLWKPMVEDIYKEEFGYSEANSKSSQDDASKAHGENLFASESRLEEVQDSMTSAAADGFISQQVLKMQSDHIPDSKMSKSKAKTALHSSSDGDQVTANSRVINFQHDHCYYPDKNTAHDQHGEESLLPTSLQYDISALSGFAMGNQVTLALGLQHHESDAFSMSDVNHIRGNNSIAASSMGPDTVDFHCMDPGKQQDRFGNSHLLHDFVV
ncbi:BEL1-like homeodomain protein 3 [Euphorbia lathyris]|uniref:BEL1-like homeodomain protein 3 n=1 Tax=Euphorbia lathyris TaxID=212925 RepID=UPI0033139ED1